MHCTVLPVGLKAFKIKKTEKREKGGQKRDLPQCGMHMYNVCSGCLLISKCLNS